MTEDKGKKPYIKFNSPNSVVAVIVFPQLRLDGRNSNSRDTLDNTVFAKKPQREVNIVNGAVDKDTTAELGIGNEETRWVKLIACLRPEYRGSADVSIGDSLTGITV